jgi:hypothetical protein
MTVVTSTVTCCVSNEPGHDTIMKRIFAFQPSPDLYPIQFSMSFEDYDGPYNEVILCVQLSPSQDKIFTCALLPVSGSPQPDDHCHNMIGL